MSRMLFRIFLGLAFSFAQDGAVHSDFHVESLVVIGPFFAAELIYDMLLAVSLDKFLEQRLIIFSIIAVFTSSR